MAFSATAAADAYETTVRALRAVPFGGDWAGSAIEAVHRIAGLLDIKNRLRDLGVTTDHLPVIAADAVADAVTRNAPRAPTEAKVLDPLRSVW